MISVTDAARFLLSLDTEKVYFNKKVLSNNGRNFYEGNARLNKMLHLAQNIYIGKTGELLFDTPFYAYDNGGVVPEILENYPMLLATYQKQPISLEQDMRDYLQKIFYIYKDAPIEELIEIDHEDPAWIEKHQFYYLPDQCMDSLKYVEDYKQRYADINEFIEGLTV